MSRNYQNHPELYPSVAAHDPHNHYLKNSIYYNVNPINHHIVLTDEEQNITVTALDFFYRYFKGTVEIDDYTQGRLAAKEFGHEAISDLANKIATSN